MLFKLLSITCMVITLSAASAIIAPTSTPALHKHARQTKNEKPVFVLIHGAWGNGDGWYKVKPFLQKQGYKVLTPTLSGQEQANNPPPSEISLDTHINDIITILEKEKISRAILVGHSYGGMVITGVADRVPERVIRLVYVDAFLPESGQSAFDLMDPAFVQGLRKREEKRGDGGIPSGSGKGPPQPLLTLDQKLKLQEKPTCTTNGTYILTIEPGVRGDAFMPDARRAQSRTWPIYILHTGHLPQLTMSSELAALLNTAALVSESDTGCKQASPAMSNQVQ